MKRILFVLAVGMVCFRMLLAAETATATLDPAKTHVPWSLDGSVHTIHGIFRLKEGKIILNLEKKTMTGKIVIDAKSGESGNSTRDRRMHAEVLESEKYPEIRFAPTSWQGDISSIGSSKVQVSGIIDMHGAVHEVTIPMELKIEHGQFSGTAQFDVPYVQWGMKDPSNFLLKVEKKVVIRVAAEGEFAEAR
jgi:polyisoprenoid-binding protein YceI